MAKPDMTISLRRAARQAFCAALFGGALLLQGCAFMNPEKRPLLDLMDRRIQPESPWTKVALIPFMMPVGITALICDVVLFRPIGQIPPAAARVKKAYWTNPDEPPGISVLMFLPRACIAAPDFFAVWILRSFFDLAETSIEEEPEPEPVSIDLPEGILPPPDEGTPP